MNAASFTHRLCGAAWIRSRVRRESMFTGSNGSITSLVCTLRVTQRQQEGQATPRLPVALVFQRALIARTPTTPTSSNGMTCPKCGTFKKSGRVSCCAPGGAWYKNCGGVGNRNADHRWFEGIEACKRKCKANAIYICVCMCMCVCVCVCVALLTD